MFRTLSQHADHLKRCEIRFNNFPESLDDQDFSQLNTFADMFCTSDVTLPECRHLTIDFEKMFISHRTNKFVLPTLLRYFPPVEVLTLIGGGFPLLKHLPVPEKLKKLEVILIRYGHDTFSEDEIVSINLSGLQSLSLLVHTFGAEYVPAELGTPPPLFDRMTGVRFQESLTSSSAQVQEVSIDFLNYGFIIRLLSSSAVAGLLRTLHITHLFLDYDGTFERRVKELKSHLPGGVFPNLTKLYIDKSYTEQHVGQFLALTPSLEELTVEFDLQGDLDFCDVKHPLRSLRRITVNTDVRPAWLESLRRKASPNGLEVIRMESKSDESATESDTDSTEDQ